MLGLKIVKLFDEGPSQLRATSATLQQKHVFTGFLPLHSDCLLPFYQSAYPHGKHSQYQQEDTEE